MIVLILSTAATWFMVGLIWLIQVVHYPLLAQLSAAVPAEAAQDHARRITPVVGPAMAVEGVTAIILLFERPADMGWVSAWAAAALLGVALAATVGFSVPQHERLAQGHDEAAAKKLIVTNWIRTVAWTARGCLLTVVLITLV